MAKSANALSQTLVQLNGAGQGEAEKPVKKAAESPSIKVEINADKTPEKANETVSNSVEEVNKKVDAAADSATEKVNENIDDANKKIGGAFGINTEE